jgi:uncharacterized protein
LKLLDINIWLSLTLSGHTHHRSTREWIETVETPSSLYFCRSTQQGLLRLLTTKEVLSRYGLAPLSNVAAWKIYDQFMTDERIAFFNEPVGIQETWKELTLKKNNSPKVWMDAWLAALALRSGMQMVTTDKAFTQFSKLDVLILTS